MLLYRIAKSKWIDDLSGYGAQINGGRWNEKGVPMVYTASSVSLAALEVLVHIEIINFVKNLELLILEIPDEIRPLTIGNDELRTNWNTYPPHESTMKLGSAWVKARKSLLLEVPSVVIPFEKNILINPSHANIRDIKIKDRMPFNFDNRLIKF